MRETTLTQRITERYKDDFLHPFPLADMLKLKSIDPDNWDIFHGTLDLYFAYVAGYASKAHRLDKRSRAVLAEARRLLSMSFFERYPALTVYRGAITMQLTPSLYRDLAAVEKTSQDLVAVIDRILKTNAGQPSGSAGSLGQ